MTEGGTVHHRVVIAIESTAVAVPYLPVFKKLVVHHLLQHVQQLSFEVALVTFSTRDGTSRSCLTTTPWTSDASVLGAWLNAVPALLEGTGTAAAQEALAEALSMLEQPSDLSPVEETASIEREIIMLWLSEAPFTSSIVASPDVASNTQLLGYKLPLTMIAAPRMSFSAFCPNHLGSKRSIQHIETEHKGRVPGAQKEPFFSQTLCACVPELVAHIMHGSSQAAVSRVVVQAIQQQAASDPELRRRHKAAAAVYRRSSAATQAPDASSRPASGAGQANPAIQPTGNTARPTGGRTAPRASNGSQAPGAAAGGADASNTATAPNAGQSAAQPKRKPPVISWHGSIVANEMGVPQMVVSHAELSVSSADRILAVSPPPNSWPSTIDLFGTVSKTSQVSAAVQTMRRDQYGKVLVKEPTLKDVFSRYQAEVLVLAPSTGHAIVIPNLPVKANEPVRLGLYMTEATRAAHFPFMMKI